MIDGKGNPARFRPIYQVDGWYVIDESGFSAGVFETFEKATEFANIMGDIVVSLAELDVDLGPALSELAVDVKATLEVNTGAVISMEVIK